jgi:5-methyltetrahydrofolate--homocysteine methyltransferase
MQRGKIIDALAQGRVLVSDGAWGTLLQQKGLRPSESPELWNIDKHEVIYQVAKDYIDAGSDMIETNSFGGNPIKLEYYGLRERAEELNEAAAALSRKAAGEEKWVIGSMGPTGKILMMGETSEDEVYEAFKLQAKALQKGGADAVIVETMSAIDEATIAIRAVSENTDLEIIGSFTYEETVNGEFRTMMGVSPTQAATEAAAAGAHILGTNCGNGYERYENVLKEYREQAPDFPLLIQPNAGIPQNINGVDVFQATPEDMAAQVRLWIESGANIIGGCCGTNAEHIGAIRKAVDEYAG